MMYAVFYRSLLALLTAFGVAVAIGMLAAPIRNALQGGRSAAAEGDATPMLSGILLLAAVLVASLVWGRDSYRLLLIAMLAAGLFAALGFIEDFIGILRGEPAWVLPWQRLVAELTLSLGLAILLYFVRGDALWLDRAGFGVFYIPFAVLVFWAVIGAVRMTDTPDGLNATVVGIDSAALAALLCIAVLCAPAGTSPDRLTEQSSLAVFGMALAGGCLGYLVFGAYPARMRIGSSGTYVLGSGLAALALLSGTALLLPLMGVCFVISAVASIRDAVAFRFGDSAGERGAAQSNAPAPRIVSMYGILTTVCSAGALLLYWFMK